MFKTFKPQPFCFPFLSSRCRGSSSRGGCSTGAEAVGTVQVPTTSNSPSSSSSSNTVSSFRRPYTCPLRGRPFHRLRRRRRRLLQRLPSTTRSPVQARPLGKFSARLADSTIISDGTDAASKATETSSRTVTIPQREQVIDIRYNTI